jgi:hypothetical protein
MVVEAEARGQAVEVEVEGQQAPADRVNREALVMEPMAVTMA